tara:strand:+ start:3673 stop:5145 length:1473 start_codon:yes stop_codon:yes gene_type:complete
MKKQSCVIAFGDIDGKKFMFKNRDRNYVPELKIYHTRRNGVEMVYFKDEHTGWVEGINEHGIAVANSALMVLWDEKEGAKSKKKDNAHLGAIGSMDANRILKTLECKDMREALDTVIKYDGGVRGHTFISDGNVGKSVEHTAKHEAYITDLIGDKDKYHARSNHGLRYPDAGYTLGENAKSSRTRLQKVLDLMPQISSPEDLIHGLYEQRGKDFGSPHNVVRRTDNMFTSSQLIYDFDEKKITLYLIPEDCDYLGYEKTFDGVGACSFEVKRISHFDEDGTFSIKPIKTNPSRVAHLKISTHTLMYEEVAHPVNKTYVDKKVVKYFKEELFENGKKVDEESYSLAYDQLEKFFKSKGLKLEEFKHLNDESLNFIYQNRDITISYSEVVGDLLYKKDYDGDVHLTGTLYCEVDLNCVVDENWIFEFEMENWNTSHLFEIDVDFEQRDYRKLRKPFKVRREVIFPFSFDISKHKPLEVDYMLLEKGMGFYKK